MQNAVTAEIMAEIDRKAQEDYGIPSIILMENAGRSVSEVIIKESRSLSDEDIAIFCGKGNNGGDGFVIARYLANNFSKRLTIYVTDIDNIKPGSSFDNFNIIRKMGLNIKPIDDFFNAGVMAENITIAVDAIFGTGFKGELPEIYAAIAKTLAANKTKLYAVDVPSGLDATTGVVSKDCFKADKTITFGLPKKGFYIEKGPEVCGEIEVKDIGFPLELIESVGGLERSD